MARSSLISFCNKQIFEEIPGLQHGRYIMKPSTDKNPVILSVGDSFYYKPDLNGDQDKVFVPSSQIAECLVQMHNTSQLGATALAYPALFSIADVVVTVEDLIKNYADLIKAKLVAQREWYKILVRMADDDWQIAQRHNMISEIQRIAARELKLERPWLLDIEEESGASACPFCSKNLINSNAPVCPNCNRVINPEKLAAIEKKLGINQPIAAKEVAKETVKA